MQVGKLRHSITIQSKSARNDRGELVNTWTNHVTTYAQVISMSAKEYLSAYDQNKAVVMYKIFMRVDHTVNPAMRVLWDDRVLNIVGILPDQTDSKFMQLICSQDDK